jgi:hypothetical protein
MADKQSDWLQCGQADCIGVQLATIGLCLAHAAERAPDVLDTELKRISTAGRVDARG